MPGGIQISNSGRGRLQEVYREYAERRGGDLEKLARQSARKLVGGMQDYGHGQVDGLYQETAKLAPSEAQIVADVKAQGWKIPSFFARGEGGGGRIGRGTPGMWGWFDFRAKRKASGKRGRPTKGEIREREAVKNRPTLEQMQAFVIKRRLDACLYLASGWLGAIADLNGILPSNDNRRGALQGRAGVDHERGGAVVEESSGFYRVEFWNRTDGIETMNAKTGFVARAVMNVIRDYRAYLERKIREDHAWLEQRKAA